MSTNASSALFKFTTLYSSTDVQRDAGIYRYCGTHTPPVPLKLVGGGGAVYTSYLLHRSHGPGHARLPEVIQASIHPEAGGEKQQVGQSRDWDR